MGNMLKSLPYIEEERWRCYIEALPDEILEGILSRLKTREAGRTCMVCRRWRNLYLSWLSRCRNLDLDFTDKKHMFKKIRESVACVLNKHQGDLDNMRIAFHHDDNHPDDCLRCTFLEWLLLANGKRVQSLDFHVKSSEPLQEPCCGHQFPSRDGCPVFNSWDRLTSLSLKSVFIDRISVFSLLSTCPNLETFLLDNAPINTFYTLQHNPKLKQFEIRNCSLLRCIRIQSAPNLKSLKLIPLKNKDGLTLELVGECQTPKLENVSLGGPLCRNWMLRLQEDAPRLQNLQLDMDVKCADDHEHCWKYDVTFPTLGNVKQLELRFTSTQEDDHDTRQMDTAIAIIRACPCLEKLTLKYEIHNAETSGDDAVKDYDLNCFGENECLKTVQVLGWSGLKSEVRFIRYLIHSSPNLQHILLDPTPPHQTETSWCGVFGPVEKSKNEIEYATRVAQQLTHYLHTLAK